VAAGRRDRAVVDNRRDGVGDGTIALRFPDGYRFTAHLESVPLDLFAKARGAAVGGGRRRRLPDYPVVAFARLTPEA